MTRNKLLTGGNRSGKTGGGLADVAMKVRGIHPYHKWIGPLRIWIWCASRSQAAAVVGRKLFVQSELKGPLATEPMIPRYEIADLGRLKIGGIEVYQRCLLKNGSELLFGWSGVESSWKRFQGGQYHGVVFDENSAEGDLLNETRLRVGDERDAHLTDAPWCGFIYWLASGTQTDENFEIFRNACKDPNVPDHELFQVPPDESYLSQDTRDSIGATMTEEQKRIRITGDSTAMEELQIYVKQWSDTRHMRTADYIVQPQDNLWCVYDPGVDHPTGIGFAAVNAQSPLKLRWVKYIQQRRLTLEDEVELIAAFLRGRTLAGLVYDISAHKTEKTGLSVKNQLQTILNRRKIRMIRGMIAGRNRHKDGIARVRHYLDPDPLNPFADSLMEFNPSQESGCQIMRSQLLKYRSYEPGKYTGPRGVVKKDDEAPDLCRYLASATPAYDPAAACGYEAPEAPEMPDVPTEQALRLLQQQERSRKMWEMIEERDQRNSSGVSLW